MFKTSTYFIKGQIPGVAKEDLINLYQRELDEQSVDSILVDQDTITFYNRTIRFVLNRFANKYSNFSEGLINIKESNTEYGIYFQASWTRLFKSAALIAVIPILLSLLAFGPNLFTVIEACTIYIFLVIFGYINTSLSFPIYFTNVRNFIEKELQEKRAM